MRIFNIISIVDIQSIRFRIDIVWMNKISFFLFFFRVFHKFVFLGLVCVYIDILLSRTTKIFLNIKFYDLILSVFSQ